MGSDILLVPSTTAAAAPRGYFWPAESMSSIYSSTAVAAAGRKASPGLEGGDLAAAIAVPVAVAAAAAAATVIWVFVVRPRRKSNRLVGDSSKQVGQDSSGSSRRGGGDTGTSLSSPKDPEADVVAALEGDRSARSGGVVDGKDQTMLGGRCRSVEPTLTSSAAAAAADKVVAAAAAGSDQSAASAASSAAVGTGTIHIEAAVAQGYITSDQQQQQQQHLAKIQQQLQTQQENQLYCQQQQQQPLNLTGVHPSGGLSARLSNAITMLQHEITKRRMGSESIGSSGSQLRPSTAAAAVAGVGQRTSTDISPGSASVHGGNHSTQQQQQQQQQRLGPGGLSAAVAGSSSVASGDLQVLGLIGRGSFANVYRAVWRGRCVVGGGWGGCQGMCRCWGASGVAALPTRTMQAKWTGRCVFGQGGGVAGLNGSAPGGGGVSVGLIGSGPGAGGRLWGSLEVVVVLVGSCQAH
jgi:hypothetical protein